MISVKKIWFFLLVSLCFAHTLPAQEKLLSKSDMVKLDFDILAAKQRRLKAGDATLQPAYRQLLTNADHLLSYAPVSVMDKADTPPSSSKHDYMSIAPYFWPDSSKPNGLPYINKDGQVNPEVRKYTDKNNLPVLTDNVYTLALAYYFSGDEKYAEHASRLLEVWFLDTATRMNPNLNYGQAVKGVTEGRAAGLIDSRFFIWDIDAIGLLAHSRYWTPHDQAGMQSWFAQFLHWLQTNNIGLEECKARNNHGVWYDAQCLSMALFLDSTQLAERIVRRTADRLDKQMDDQGFFPLEMERTTSLHYTVFVLNAFFIVADLSTKTRLNLWTWQTPDGRSLKKAFDTTLPYIGKDKPWTGPQITAFNFDNAIPLLLRGETHFGCDTCGKYIFKLTTPEYSKLLINLL